MVTLDAEVEKRVINSLSKNEQGIYLAMGPDLMQNIITQLADYLKKFNDLSQTLGMASSTSSGAVFFRFSTSWITSARPSSS